MAFLQGRKVAGFVEGRSIDPALEQDAVPFESKRSNGGVVGRALGFVEPMNPILEAKTGPAPGSPANS